MSGATPFPPDGRQRSGARPGRLARIFNTTFVWLVFTATTPFVFFVAIPHHPYKLLVFAGLGLSAAALALGSRIRLEDPLLVAILGLQMAYAAAAAVMHEAFLLGIELRYVNLCLQFATVLVLYLYIVRFHSVERIAVSSITAMAVMGALGAVAFALAALGILPILWEFQGPTWPSYSFGLTFSPTVISYGSFTFLRVAGFFDEPGTLAFYITFAILLNRLYGRSQRIERLLIVTGLFTFSLAFFVSLVLYGSIFYLRQRHVRGILLALSVLAMCAVYVARTRGTSILSEQVYSATVMRFQRGEAGSGQVIAGDNRSVLLVAALKAFKAAPLFGHGFSAAENPKSAFYGMQMDANVMWPFAAHGLIGVLVYFGAYVYWTFLVFGTRQGLDRACVGAWVIVTANLLQRPNVFGGAYGYFVYIFFIYATRWRLRRVSAAAVDAPTPATA